MSGARRPDADHTEGRASRTLNYIRVVELQTSGLRLPFISFRFIYFLSWELCLGAPDIQPQWTEGSAPGPGPGPLQG